MNVKQMYRRRRNGCCCCCRSLLVAIPINIDQPTTAALVVVLVVLTAWIAGSLAWFGSVQPFFLFATAGSQIDRPHTERERKNQMGSTYSMLRPMPVLRWFQFNALIMLRPFFFTPRLIRFWDDLDEQQQHQQQQLAILHPGPRKTSSQEGGIRDQQQQKNKEKRGCGKLIEIKDAPRSPLVKAFKRSFRESDEEWRTEPNACPASSSSSPLPSPSFDCRHCGKRQISSAMGLTAFHAGSLVRRFVRQLYRQELSCTAGPPRPPGTLSRFSNVDASWRLLATICRMVGAYGGRHRRSSGGSLHQTCVCELAWIGSGSVCVAGV
ncbi:hypothetical protein AND_005667 [Anopheles darlingi]|uniref:Uncharacterized protein n=1 Tax=Anopheles darlingi TaxID=43151 RepID=W5JIK6_ANODA|nr:hypothetical protein AND_005667 [Anopheles darlingi]